MKNNIYINYANYVEWLFGGSERREMIEWLGEAVEECLVKGKQYTFDFEESLTNNLHCLPTYLLHDGDGVPIFDVECELAELDGDDAKVFDDISNGKVKVIFV